MWQDILEQWKNQQKGITTGLPRAPSDLYDEGIGRSGQQMSNRPAMLPQATPSAVEIEQQTPAVNPIVSSAIRQGINTGNVGIDIGNSLFPPTALEAAALAKDPETAFILRDMYAATQPGYAGGVEMGAELGAEAASEFGAGLSSVGSGVQAHAIRAIGQKLAGAAFQYGGSRVDDAGGKFLGQLGRTVGTSTNIEDIPFKWADELFGKSEGRDLTEQLFNPVGAVLGALGTHICTATSEHSYLTKIEKGRMKKLKLYVGEHHKGWLDAYLKYGTDLTKAIAKQEKDINSFYDSIRIILIEPVAHLIGTPWQKKENMEKAFQIYLAVTQLLFKTYLPKFEFKEL